MFNYFDRLSIKRKLTFLILATCLSILLVTFTTAFASLWYLYRQNTLQELQSLAKVVSENSSAALLFRDSHSLKNNLASLGKKETIIQAAIFLTDGTLLAEYSRNNHPSIHKLKLDYPALIRNSYDIHNGHIDLVHPIVLDGEKVGVLYLQNSLSDLYRNLIRVGGYLTLIVCSGLFIALLMANWLQRFITRPLVQLTGAIEQVSESKSYQVRVERSGDDEIGRLATGFNAMLAQIQRRDQDLEEQVAARTHKLEVSERQWAEAFNAVNSPMFLNDGEGRIIKANQAYLEHAGCTQEQAFGKLYWQLFPSLDAPFFSPHEEEKSDSNRSSYEREITIADNLYRARSFIIRDQQGLYLYEMHLLEDITEPQRYLEKLKRFEQIISTASDLMAFIDKEHRFLSVNSLYAEYFATVPEAIVGKHLKELLDEKRYNLFLQHHDQLFKGGQKIELCSWFDYPTYGRRFMEITYTPYFEKENDVSGIVFRAKDVTEKVEQEANLRLSAKVFESTNEGIIVTDPEGKIVTVNPAFYKITGYREEDVLGQNPRLLKSGRHNKDFYQQMWQQLAKTGQWRGEIWNRRNDGEVYPELLTISSIKDEQGETVNYVGLLTDITSLKKAAAELEYQAHHHPLTGLPNRLLLHARLQHSIQHAKRENQRGAVLFLDLDNFKKINDSLGHNSGDQILKEVASRLQEQVREVDTVSHLSGDEFVVVLQKTLRTQDVKLTAQRILDSLKAPFYLDSYELYIGASIGIVEFGQDHDDIGVLLKNADTAMYKAKEQGKSCYRFYTPELTAEAVEKVQLETELRWALEREQLELYYQPQVCLPQGNIIAMEALARWRHPDLGQVPPDKFIPLSEETGLIIPLGEWALRTACQQFMLWRQQGYDLERIAVNLSGKQIHLKRLPQTVTRILRETGLPASDLELEITEGFVMQHPEQSIDVLQQIRAIGVELSIDDFGTGHSSLNYLKRLPINRLKIDRSFVWDIGSNEDGETITRTIIAMGQSLNLQITAEGVETEIQKRFLEELGCNEAQGFLFSKARSAQQIETLLRKTTATAEA